MYFETEIREFFNHLLSITGGSDMVSAFVFMSLVGAVTYGFKTIFSTVTKIAQKQLTTTLRVNSFYGVYHDIIEYLYDHGVGKKSRTISLANKAYDYENEKDGKLIKGIGKGTHYSFIFGVPVKIQISEETSGTTVFQYLSITKLGRSHKFFNKFFNEIKSKVENNRDTTKTRVRNLSREAVSLGVKSQPKQDISTVIIPDSTKRKILNGLDTFINSEDYYIKNYIPYQYGILLYGPPGTGKTSLIRAIAGYLNRDIIIADCVNTFKRANIQFTPNDIIVLEEVDTIGLKNRDEEESELADIMTKNLLGKILTEMDGIQTNHGRVLIMTTNHIEDIDKSLLRPGRIDCCIEVGYLTNETFFKMLDKFSISYTKSNEKTFEIKEEMSPAMLQQAILEGLNIDEITELFCKK